MLSAALVVLLVLAGSAALGYLVMRLDIASSFTPFYPGGDTPVGAAINSLFFLLLVLAGAGMLLALTRRRRLDILHLVLAVAIFVSYWGILEIYAAVLVDEELGALVDLMSLAIAFLTAFLVVKPLSLTLLSALLLLYGVMVGPIFTAMLTPLSTVAVSATLAAYDAYSVTRGPLKRFLETLSQHQDSGKNRGELLRGAVVHIGPLSLGMGDVLVYSMLSPLFLATPSYSLLRWIVCSVGLLAGFLATLWMLRRRHFMPALPLPVAFSLSAYATCYLLGL
uniref:Uncharacterized protein n=2 Tax=Thermofilum pendens TaxID=2269 RepID=A0A7C3SLI4_THEPE